MMHRFAPFALISALPALGAAYAPRPDLDAGRYLKALDDADAVLKLQPGNALAWAARSQALTALVRLPEAMEAAQKALALQPGLADALLARGLALGGVAVQQRNLGSVGSIQKAMRDLRAATQADPKLVAAWMTLGLAYEQLPGFLLGGSTSRALQCAESLKQVDPARGLVLQGTVLALEKRWPEAQPCFAQALAKAPQDPEVIYGYLDALGSRPVREVLGDEGQKRLQVQEALRLLPAAQDRARPLTAICDALIDAGRHEEAWKIAKEALPSDAPSLLRMQLGKIAARSGLHLEEGLAALDQVLREPLEGGTGGYGSAHWRRGQVLKALGRKDEARAAAAAALRLDPKDPKARGLLRELE